MNCVCLICLRPTPEWFRFLSTFKAYDIYVIIDDNSKDYKEEYSEFKDITTIQISDEECKQNGFSNTCTITIPKEVTGWSKALYYFSSIQTNYDRIWFFEDDVFFNDEETLRKIDAKYTRSDLLSNTYSENATGKKDTWHWSKIDIQFPPPYYSAMICCVRMSSRLLKEIKTYATGHKTLFFTEALFPTLSKKYDLQYDTPSELQNIEYRRDYKDEGIDANNLYHPIKDIAKHANYREMLRKRTKEADPPNTGWGIWSILYSVLFTILDILKRSILKTRNLLYQVFRLDDTKALAPKTLKT